MSRKRVGRLMRLMGWEAIYRPRTSQPAPGHRVYLYLLKEVEITQPNQVWATDITYIPMAHGFLYLAWRLSNTLDTQFCVAALEEALRHGHPELFNTDHGSQFTSEAFTGLLEQKGIRISMDGKGRYLDNLFVERLWRTVKYEEVYLKAYTGGWEAEAGINAYFRFYNTQRPHRGPGLPDSGRGVQLPPRGRLTRWAEGGCLPEAYVVSTGAQRDPLLFWPLPCPTNRVHPNCSGT